MSTIDPQTEFLRTFINDNASALNRDTSRLRDHVFSPFAPHRERELSGRRAYLLLSTCVELAMAKMEHICSQQSLDFWMAYVRRLSLLVDFEPTWVMYATLAAIRWSDWSQDTSAGHFAGDGEFGVAFAVTPGALADCCMLVVAASMVNHLNNLRRWVGKGARVVLDASGELRKRADDDVVTAVEHYERRRPGQILADEGILADLTRRSFDSPAALLLSMAAVKPPLEIAVRQRPTRYSVPMLPVALSATAVMRALRPYEEAMVDVFGIGVDELLQTLHACGTRTMESFPTISLSASNLLLEGSGIDPQFEHKLSFMVSLCRRGFLRFPVDHLKEQLATVPLAPEIGSGQAGAGLVERFFKSFALERAVAGRIDVERLEPVPVLYTSPGGQCYLDFVAVPDFLRWIVVESRQWYQSQHGDHFNLALKRHIQAEVGHIEVLGKRKEFRAPNGDRAQVDLLVRSSAGLYVVECKAYAKPRDFWLGDPRAVRARTRRIKEGVEQAARAARVVQAVALAGDPESEIGRDEVVDWVVCMPSQEFIKPLDRFGLLDVGVPKICTPEELVSYFQHIAR
ncbi:MAG TPA: NERD domain-containing protein [Longimicrobiaceae bacterium]|nr:NERD domain-containing protein [Longimicrobiaceae bacterium]